MEGVQEGGGMVFEGVSEMVGDVGLRCANPTYALCICVDHT